jgi:hypothetical protein
MDKADIFKARKNGAKKVLRRINLDTLVKIVTGVRAR